VEEHRGFISGTLNLPTIINTLGRKAANILGAKSKVPRKQLLFYTQNIQETDSNIISLVIIKF